MNTDDIGSIGWEPPAEVPDAPEIIGWGNEIIGWGNEIIGNGDPEIVGCPIGYADGSFGAGSDDDWIGFANAYHFEDEIGFIPLIVGAIAGIAGAVSSGAAAAASVVAPVVAAVGGVTQVANMIGGGIKQAEGLVKAAQGGDPKALEKLKGLKRKKAIEMERKGEKKLAELMLRARKGDLKAQAVIAGIDILKNEQVQKLGVAGKFMAKFGMVPPKDLVQGILERNAGKNWKKFVKAAETMAKKSGKWPAKPPAVKLPVAEMKKAAIANGIARLRKGNEKLKKSNVRKGTQGALVLADGARVVRGRWLPGSV